MQGAQALTSVYQEIWSYKGGYVMCGSGCRVYVSVTPETSKRAMKHTGI